MQDGPAPISPGQNLNLVAATKTCPHAKKVSGPGSASTSTPAPSAQGYVTRFKPSMQEIKNSGKLVTPSVWDLHLHHVVWLRGLTAPTFASGEEKTVVKMPQGYGHKVGADATWGLNYMIHSLNASTGREVQITWKIDWVPETSPARTDIKPTTVEMAGPRRLAADLPGLRRRAGLRHGRRRQVRLPRRRQRADRARLRGGVEQDQPGRHVDRARRRRAPWSSAPATCIQVD